MTDGLQTILDWYLQNINYWSIIMCMTIESSILPFPAELIIPPAAWKAANGELNLIGIILTGSVWGRFRSSVELPSCLHIRSEILFIPLPLPNSVNGA